VRREEGRSRAGGCGGGGGERRGGRGARRRVGEGEWPKTAGGRRVGQRVGREEFSCFPNRSVYKKEIGIRNIGGEEKLRHSIPRLRARASHH